MPGPPPAASSAVAVLSRYAERVNAEKRRSPRYDVESVRGHLRADHDARVLNLSVEGCALETGSWLQVGQRYNLRVRSGDEKLELSGVVAWCRLVGTRGMKGDDRQAVYRAGLAFGDALNESAHQILDFIRRTGLVGVTSRVFGRFKVRREEAVNVTFDHPFDLRRLSRNGALIEADLLPEVGARFVLEIETPAGGTLRPTVVVRSLEQTTGGDGEPTTAIGVEFEPLDEGDRRLLDHLIEEQMGIAGGRSDGPTS